MDFLDPKKSRRNYYYLMVLYGLMSIGLVLATVILLSLAYGIGIGSDGKITQNGAVITGSMPSGATIYVNDKKQNNNTNARLVLESGRYVVRYEKTGYRSWQHSAVVSGGNNNYLDYALMIPEELDTVAVKSFSGHVNFSAQSPDKRWLIVGSRGGVNEFLRYDLKNISSPPVLLNLPVDALTDPDNTKSWQLVDWADDNKHLLVNRNFTSSSDKKAASEYIMIDINKIDASPNLTTKLKLDKYDALQLFDDKYDAYYIMNSSTHQLKKATLGTPRPQLILEDVAAYKPYSDDKLLYVKVPDTGATQTSVHQLDGKDDYYLGSIGSAGPYLLDITRHNNRIRDNWYVAFGSASDSRVEVYKDPIVSLSQMPNQPLIPIQVLKVSNPKVLEFSTNTRFIMASNGSQSYVYDLDDDMGYLYDLKAPGDEIIGTNLPKWIDGYHFVRPQSGQMVLFDYDNTNHQSLMSVDQSMPVYFTPDHKYIYSFDVNSNGNSLLNRTALRTPEDL